MKAVMLSLRPQWCEKIFNGSKSIEVRKSRPSLDMPFKVYVYMTKPKPYLSTIIRDGDNIYGDIYHGKTLFIKSDRHYYNRDYQTMEQRVIGSFLCDRITCCQAYCGESGEKHLTNLFRDEVKRTCLTEHEMFDYIVGKGKKEGTGWLWNITEPTLFDKPRGLGEFYRSLLEKVLENGEYDCRKEWDVLCLDAPEGGDYCAECPYGGRVPLTRAPQSWVYCETIDER